MIKKNPHFCLSGDMFAFLGSVMRQSLLHADASSQSMPVYNIDGLVDSALQDGGPMQRLFHSLASNILALPALPLNGIEMTAYHVELY